MLFKVLKRAIERGNFESKEEMADKISILFANNQLTEEQYIELINLLNN
mgnify:CR=1 FL=1